MNAQAELFDCDGSISFPQFHIQYRFAMFSWSAGCYWPGATHGRFHQTGSCHQGLHARCLVGVAKFVINYFDVIAADVDNDTT